jgi:hypothetical protein
MSVKYSIHIEKDGSNVTARYDISVPIDTTELLASFELSVEGKNLIDKFLPQKAFTGTKFCLLADSAKDVPVTFGITTNGTWTADGEEILRGAKRFDDVSFSN